MAFRSICFGLAALAAVAGARCICEGASDGETAEEAVDIARQDPRIKDVQANFPELRLVPEYSDAYGVWILEIVLGDREVGVASVSLELGSVLEFDFNADNARRDREDQDSESRPARTLVSSFLPRLEGPTLAWVSFLLVLIFAGDFSRFFSRRNLDIVLLYLLCPFMNLVWENGLLAFTGIFAVTTLFFVRCLFGVRPGPRNLENGSRLCRAACAILVFSALFHVQSVYEKGIDDSGLWSVIGGKYLRETGKLPYGTGFGTNCVYGPLMYFLHLPANAIFPLDVAIQPGGSEVSIGDYHAFEMRGAQTTALLFDILAMAALFLFGRRYGDKRWGVLLALLFALNPYILGVGGAFGLQQTSHMTGIALVIFALAFATSPFLSGMLLGIACGMLYYPVFLVPLWAAYYMRTAGGRHAVRFLGAIAALGFVCLGLILALTVSGPGHEGMSALGAFVNDTIYQQQFSDGYGESPFSFWGQYPSVAAWGKPLAGVLYLAFCLGVGLLPGRMDMKRLVSLTAAVLVGTQLVLSHGGGTYIGFYIAPFLITLFGPHEYPIARGKAERDMSASVQ